MSGERTIQEGQVFNLVFGRVIAALRDQRGLSQGQLAEACGVSQPLVSKIEAGKARPDPYLYTRLAQALGTDVQGLNSHVVVAMERAREAAEAATKKKAASSEQAWSEAFKVAGAVGLIGLIVFAVAAVLGDDGPSPPK